MAALKCEICGGKLIGKPGGLFECEYCGMEYSTAWAKAKIQEIKGTVRVEGTVEVKGTVKLDGPVKMDTTQNVENLLKFAKAESRFVAAGCIPRYRNGTVSVDNKRRQNAFYATLNDILRMSPQEYWVYLFRCLDKWWKVDEYKTISLLGDGLAEDLEDTPDWKTALIYAPEDERKKLQAAMDARKEYWNEVRRKRREEEDARRLEEQRRITEAEELRRRAEEELQRIAEEKRLAKMSALTNEKAALINELRSLKGLFTGKRRKEIEARLAEIETELKGLNGYGSAEM